MNNHAMRLPQNLSFCFALVLTAVCSPHTAFGERPNVVYIIQDALRADRVDAQRNGVPLMPNMQSLAASGTRFTNAVAPTTWTTPSMASVFTCRYVDTNATYSEGSSLPDAAETMAEYFKAAGYSTIGIQVSGYLAPAYGFAQGFDRYDMMATGNLAQTTAHAIEVLQEGLTEPFFVYIHYSGPHPPYTPDQSYRDAIGYPDPALSSAERAIAEDFMPYMYDHLEYLLGAKPALEYTPLSPVGEEAVRMLYDGEVLQSDANVGQFVDATKLQYPNTLFVLSADHGEHFWEHDYLAHAVTLYEPLLRVPLVFQGPGVPAGQVISANAGTIALLPTLADILELPTRSQWQAQSLFEAADPAGPTFAYTAGTTPPYVTDLDMVRLEPMKLIRNRSTGAVELYNLANDPNELVNLAGENPATVAQLKALLDKHLQQNIRIRSCSGSITAAPGGWLEEGAFVTLTAPEGSNYQWIKDGEALVDEPSRITGSTERTLTISAVEMEDAGAYECMYDTNEKATAQTLAMTQPYPLTVVSAGSLPASGPKALALLVALVAFSSVVVFARARRAAS